MNRPGLVLCLAALLPGTATAATLYVDASLTTPYPEIQDAIDDALDGDTVLVFPGTYGPIDFLGKDLVVRSDGGPLNTTIHGGGVGPAVLFDNAEPPTALLQGFTLTGGTGLVDAVSGDVLGGGLLIRRAAAPRISGNVISGNTAEYGGGLAVAAAEPTIYGNTIQGNTGTVQGGGTWFQADPTANAPTVFACNLVRDNSSTGTGGVFLGIVAVHATNNRIHANSGERGGVWATATSTGFWHNNTVTANAGDVNGAGGVENNSTSVDFVNNVIAFNTPGYGAIRDSTTPLWSFNDLWGNGTGEYAGAAGDPTATAGNVLIDPLFAAFTPGDPYDDDLTLTPASQLIDFGSPDPVFLDLDGTSSDIGFTGGPHTDCDLDGDGVRPADVPTDCIPDDPLFHPGAFEGPDGLDHDCDGWGTDAFITLIPDDGGLIGAGQWEFDEPTSVPGVGHLSTDAWCTDCDGPVAGGTDSSLTFTADFTSVVTAGTQTRLQFAHAYDTGAGDEGFVEVDVTGAGGWTLDSSFGGDSDGWVLADVDLSAHAGGTVDVRWRYEETSSSGFPGWAVASVQVQVEDADGDGRAADLQDCDDADLFTYIGAPEIAYDGVDQDCDGHDLEDVDGDGFLSMQVGGLDCDDYDATAFPGGEEIAYDGIDQDCVGGDLNDLDEDAWVGGPDGDDCDDDDPAINPGAADVPYDGVDQDCDGADLVDVDGDGYDGDRPPPFGDCDDEDRDVNPGAEEVCGDEVDNDCDERVDLVDDGDLDGVDRCAGDCDDANPDVAPGLEEVCDGVDTDCDGAPAEGEVDADADGSFVCDGDCDDANDLVAPSLPEICDAIDNDCDAAIDEDHDRDLDGYSGCRADCDDQVRTIHPGASPRCEPGFDDDCDGVEDLTEPECTGEGGTGCNAHIAAAAPGSGLGLLLLSGLAAPRRRRATRVRR